MDSRKPATITEPVVSYDRAALDDPVPKVHLLRNQEMVTMITAAGAGYTAKERTAVTRWLADRTRDADGFFLYIRDLESGEYWSAGFQPTLSEPDEYHARFHIGSAEIERRDHGIVTKLEVCLSPHSNVEIRRCTITNTSAMKRHLDITSYAELVLQDPVSDASHLAFSKLFVETEFVRERDVILIRRRKRSDGDNTCSACHFMLGDNGITLSQFETDRNCFIGRGRSLIQPIALESRDPLSGKTGSVLDSIGSLRCDFILEPNESACVSFFLGASERSDSLIDMVEEYRRPGDVDLAFESAQRIAGERLGPLQLDKQRLADVVKLGGSLIYGAYADERKESSPDQSASSPWSFTEELPLFACSINGQEDLETASLLLKAQKYYREHQLESNMVLLNQSALRDDIDLLLSESDHDSQVRNGEHAPKNIVVLDGMELSHEQSECIEALSRSTANGHAVPRQEQTQQAQPYDADVDLAVPVPENNASPRHSSEQLKFHNGIGGFSREENEYVIQIERETDGTFSLPPLPWCNIISNEFAGILVSETGAGYTWVGNSRENRLTPWYNDPVCDPHGEALYIRDEDKRVFWSSTPGPVKGAASYEVRHGLGYTVFRNKSMELTQEVLRFVPCDAPLAITRLTLTNDSDRRRRLSLFNYLTWELSAGRPRWSQQIQTSIDPSCNTVFAVNHSPSEFSKRVAFATLVSCGRSSQTSYTCDRTEFLGRNGSLEAPRAVKSSVSLSGRQGTSFDACAASQSYVELEPGETTQLCVLLGQAEGSAEARELIDRFSSVEQVDKEYQSAKARWKDLVKRVQIETPAPELDFMVNCWLPYQNLSCRMMGRSAYYQSGGAFGFRDQLQDSAALIYHSSDITRNQILLHAAHQFREGDVMHWWHPPFSKGIRTRFSDDLVWLPLVAAEYVNTTGDTSLLREDVRFISGPSLPGGEAEVLMRPEDSGESGTVYEHCCRSLDRATTTGEHGLPLIGCGDWNDGMNRVGQAGYGESVWMGFFLDCAITAMLPFCEDRGDTHRVERYRSYRADLREALNSSGWDGEWYRRAYFDDGTPLGTAEADECKIDALVQAWAVLSGVAPAEKAESAVTAVENHLVDEHAGIIRLLYPPFDRMLNDPGYIKGYLPGVRENGGQYTHGVLWYVRAMAKLGCGDRAVQLLKMLSPISHTKTPKEVAVYKAEPYVIAADVYGESPNVGRAGWTWYTGSAGWMLRVALESILGLQIERGETLVIDPCIDPSWQGYSISFMPDDRGTRYEIVVSNPDRKQNGVSQVSWNGKELEATSTVARIPLLRDGNTHQVEITI